MKGFTLVELIIVLAIFGIFAALIIGLHSDTAEKKLWMGECVQHEPRYQCEYKWKLVHPDPAVNYVFH